jgi:cytochrome c
MFTLIRFASVLSIFFAIESFAGAANAQDAKHGAQVFNACAVCHATDNSARVGPGLQGIVGRHAGSMSGFRYSRAMKNASITWDEKSLDAYITAPQALVPGTTMPFSGIPNAGDRADLIAYLETLK